jgi:hypothetical protein
VSTCASPIVIKQRLGKNFTASTNIHATIEELLDASFLCGPYLISCSLYPSCCLSSWVLYALSHFVADLYAMLSYALSHSFDNKSHTQLYCGHVGYDFVFRRSWRTVFIQFKEW